jgi:hypothetical protein
MSGRSLFLFALAFGVFRNVAVAEDAEPPCNLQSRMEVAKKYSFEDMDRITMMETITRNAALTKEYSIKRERCLNPGKSFKADPP